MSTKFEDLMAQADPALAIVTVASETQMAGCVVGFHSQCSIEPPRYAVWLSKANLTYRVALFAESFAVHFLDGDDHDLAELFGGTTGDTVDKFAQCEWVADPGGAPLLTRCPNRMVLTRLTQLDDGSDHVCLIGGPVRADSTPRFRPLRLSASQDISPGHEAEEREAPTRLRAGDRSAADAASTPTETSPDEIEVAAAGAGHAIDVDDPESLS